MVWLRRGGSALVGASRLDHQCPFFGNDLDDLLLVQAGGHCGFTRSQRNLGAARNPDPGSLSVRTDGRTPARPPSALLVALHRFVRTPPAPLPQARPLP